MKRKEHPKNIGKNGKFILFIRNILKALSKHMTLALSNKVTLSFAFLPFRMQLINI